jgi:hypothetical protein
MFQVLLFSIIEKPRGDFIKAGKLRWRAYYTLPFSCELMFELNALRADFTNLQHNKDLHRRNIAIQAYGV